MRESIATEGAQELVPVLSWVEAWFVRSRKLASLTQSSASGNPEPFFVRRNSKVF